MGRPLMRNQSVLEINPGTHLGIYIRRLGKYYINDGIANDLHIESFFARASD